MKSISVSLNTLLICALIVAAIIFGVPKAGVQAAGLASGLVQTAGDPPPGCDPGRTVQVSGSAVVNVIPDRALIQLGVQSNGSTPKHVEAVNSATINRMTQAMQALGVADKDIVTDWYVLDPVYDDHDSLIIKGYRINNVVAVTLRDLSKVNQVIAAALEAGANRIVNVDFYLTDLRKYRDQARELAMKAAREKAQALATTAGTQTGCVMSINENTWSYYNGWWYGRDNSNLMMQNTIQNAAPAGGEGQSDPTEAGPVDLGQISVRGQVSASFGLK